MSGHVLRRLFQGAVLLVMTNYTLAAAPMPDPCDGLPQNSACHCFEHICKPLEVGCEELDGDLYGTCEYDYQENTCTTPYCEYLEEEG